MLRFRSAPLKESRQSPNTAIPIRMVPPGTPFVRRQLSREASRGLEILGHAIEYLADEYAVDTADKGPLGRADPRVEAIQVLKSLNRSLYFSGTEVQPAFDRIRRWFQGSRTDAG